MKKTIVVVDDFENTRFVVKMSLRNTNAEILEAADGKEALKLFDGRKIDLLITDYNMPEMNGAELVKNVKDMIDYQYTPILMLTTERNEEKKKMAMDVKITAWIQKPFKQEDFQSIVKKCLRIN
jgi:two-component system chemotaxis response regulator CheY